MGERSSSRVRAADTISGQGYRCVERTVEQDLPRVVRSLDAAPHEIR